MIHGGESGDRRSSLRTYISASLSADTTLDPGAEKLVFTGSLEVLDAQE